MSGARRRRGGSYALGLWAGIWLWACSPPGAVRPGDGEPAPLSPGAASEAPSPVEAPSAAGPGAAAGASAVAEAPPAVEAAAPDGGAAEDAGAGTPEGASPPVNVANIGMHIGGGPNDAATKAPIKQSVAPHFDALARCFAKVDDPTKGGDFGVDLRIEREGGLATVSHPRTALKGEGFKECVVDVFQRIRFKKPKGGATVVSYSLRFTP